MTDRQRKFCDEYLIDCNASRAYKAVYGVSDNVAKANGCRLLTNANVRGYIDKKLDLVTNCKVATAKDILWYLTNVMNGNEYDEVVVTVTSGEPVKINKLVCSRERIRVATLLGKHYGLFEDKLQANGKGENTADIIVDNVPYCESCATCDKR